MKHSQDQSEKDSRNSEGTQIRHTADAVAVARFQEGKRKKPLLVDPYAYLFVSAQGEEILRVSLKRWPFFAQYLVVRAKYFDDHLKEFFQGNHVSQIVILGAGNDMRASRLSFLKEKKVYEVDFQDRILQKKNLLKKALGKLPHNTFYVGSDVRRGSLIKDLVHAGFVISEKTVFVMEGLIYYLKQPGVDHLFDELSQIPLQENLYLLDHISVDMTRKSQNPEKRNKPPYPSDLLNYLTLKKYHIKEKVFLSELTTRYFQKSYEERWWAIACER